MLNGNNDISVQLPQVNLYLGTLQVLRLIYCSMAGVPEAEMCGLLSEGSTEGQPGHVPLVVWATVRRYLKPFLRSVVFWYNGATRLQFFHSSMSQVKPIYQGLPLHYCHQCGFIIAPTSQYKYIFTLISPLVKPITC